MTLSPIYIKTKVSNDLHTLPHSLQDEAIEKLLTNRNLLTEDILSNILQTIKQKYLSARIEPGYAAGTVAAQSMGEPSTQIVLRTFHYAGVGFRHTAGGLDRLEEIVNATYNIKQPMMEIILNGNNNEKEILQQVKKLKNITIATLKHEHDRTVIYTEGSNLKDVLNLEGINKQKTITNNIREIEWVLGIEAARQSIIDQLYDIYTSEGLDINIRHIILVADLMTMNGKVESLGRVGIMKYKKSPVARACYEQAVFHMYNAAVYGEYEEVDGIAENIVVGLHINIGTGRKEIQLFPIENRKEGKYYCKKCKSFHRMDSKVGKKHFFLR